ncbi:hypothetical protein AC579_9234 [Pseudocercospora musae]|uniref:Uncharacterized protein n=1 Tax=Pseudocercospora musae TaxID=113226 RepID=A0A139IAK5_9PEZI|nr:hypothetical protein AC579_9234 [Pseudocercospora musae]
MAIPGQGLYTTGEERHDPEKPWRKSKFPAHASWNDAEEDLEESSADILTIIDSCSASSIWKDGGQEDRSWEVSVSLQLRAADSHTRSRVVHEDTHRLLESQDNCS